jgi:hypothetical protein
MTKQTDRNPQLSNETIVLIWLITMVSLVLVVLILATVGAPDWAVEAIKSWPVP